MQALAQHLVFFQSQHSPAAVMEAKNALESCLNCILSLCNRGPIGMGMLLKHPFILRHLGASLAAAPAVGTATTAAKRDAAAARLDEVRGVDTGMDQCSLTLEVVEKVLAVGKDDGFCLMLQSLLGLQHMRLPEQPKPQAADAAAPGGPGSQQRGRGGSQGGKRGSMGGASGGREKKRRRRLGGRGQGLGVAGDDADQSEAKGSDGQIQALARMAQFDQYVGALVSTLRVDTEDEVDVGLMSQVLKIMLLTLDADAVMAAASKAVGQPIGGSGSPGKGAYGAGSSSSKGRVAGATTAALLRSEGSLGSGAFANAENYDSIVYKSLSNWRRHMPRAGSPGPGGRSSSPGVGRASAGGGSQRVDRSSSSSRPPRMGSLGGAGSSSRRSEGGRSVRRTEGGAGEGMTDEEVWAEYVRVMRAQLSYEMAGALLDADILSVSTRELKV